MNINKLLETIKDTSRDYVGTNGCLYQDITREELDLIVKEIERLNKALQNIKDFIDKHTKIIKETNMKYLVTDVKDDNVLMDIVNKALESNKDE